MRRLSIRWLLALTMLLVTMLSFFLANDLIFAAFSRSVWLGVAKRVEGHMHYVLCDIGTSADLDDQLFNSLRAWKRPIEIPDEYKGRVELLAESLSRGYYGCVIFDASGTRVTAYPRSVHSYMDLPPKVFELLRSRFGEYERRQREGTLQLEDASPGGPRIVFWRLLFGPLGILNLTNRYHHFGSGDSFFAYAFSSFFADDNAISRARAANSLSQKEKEQRLEAVVTLSATASAIETIQLAPLEGEQLYADATAETTAVDLNLHGLQVMCLPHTLRVSFEIPGDRQVLVTPLTSQGRLVGYVAMIASWSEAKMSLHSLASQMLAVAVVMSLLMGAIAVWVSGLLVRPLRRVTNTAQRVAEGDLSARTGFSAGRNEIYAVGYVFDGMVDHLEEMLAEQRRFIGDASHELKTPITSLLGVAEVLSILRNSQSHSEQFDRSLGIMKRELERMTDLVKDLLMLSRTGELDIPLSTDPISANELIEAACQASLSDVMQRQMERITGNDIWFIGDQKLLVRALRNIIDNALHYTPADKKITISKRQEGDMVVIEVDDEGCGISAEHLKDLGKRFYRTDSGRARCYGGTGLGLAISRAIMARHHGRLDITSQEGQGTQVQLYLPLPSPEALEGLPNEKK